ncbi:hypothetical protein K491DRAFT_682362 [Lophiostoma macrostomum CBS 122681]|uniref:Uncharacterized protein n=1 Tax=Lophiostoma macrostomum CBS 122681 TaxID=1314788 RepID=A0A6A6SU33_9PLEO|nr:hypothetical protein K491DRAFT_682362 [Lophiostoma macrostomum CBS 122681]
MKLTAFFTLVWLLSSASLCLCINQVAWYYIPGSSGSFQIKAISTIVLQDAIRTMALRTVQDLASAIQLSVQNTVAAELDMWNSKFQPSDINTKWVERTPLQIGTFEVNIAF